MAQYAADAGQPAPSWWSMTSPTICTRRCLRAEDWETRRQYQRWQRSRPSHGMPSIAWWPCRKRSYDGSRIGHHREWRRYRALPTIKPTSRSRGASCSSGRLRIRPTCWGSNFSCATFCRASSGVTLHVIAGLRHQRFWDLRHPASRWRASSPTSGQPIAARSIVIAPLVVSAGTNIKILEAMAMGKAIVSTEAGIHGLDFARGEDLIVADSGAETADAIMRLLDQPAKRIAIERHARSTAERSYGWDAIALRQTELYRELLTLNHVQWPGS